MSSIQTYIEDCWTINTGATDNRNFFTTQTLDKSTFTWDATKEAYCLTWYDTNYYNEISNAYLSRELDLPNNNIELSFDMLIVNRQYYYAGTTVLGLKNNSNVLAYGGNAGNRELTANKSTSLNNFDTDMTIRTGSSQDNIWFTVKWKIQNGTVTHEIYEGSTLLYTNTEQSSFSNDATELYLNFFIVRSYTYFRNIKVKSL